MANTYTQIHIHVVFATKLRMAQIDPLWQEELHRYITAIVQSHNHKMMQINSMPDHVHMLVGMRPDQSLSELVKIVKVESSKWIKRRTGCDEFAWQAGFGAFANSKNQLPGVILYIQRQQEHHSKRNFREEYLYMLKGAGVEYDERFIFKDPE